VVTALYRRYRPETFAELIGQSQVTDPLRTALRSDRVNHAYLFSGPRGCGKTTSARILARCLNCVEGPTDTPCGVCPSCVELSREGGGSLDVVEIDAASHNGVDDARDLRERAVFAPARDRFKIFILDEAHMVTPQGFNALLKIVEEPPEHIKFIFATTEPEKVIGTIRSRTHHYPFRLVPPAQMLEYVQQLCEREGVEVQPGVLPLVVRSGGGSVRDTLSLLDQLIAGSEAAPEPVEGSTSSGSVTVEYERAVALLGYTHGALLDDVVDALGARDAAAVFAAVDRVIQTGQDPRRFVEDLLERLRDLIIVAAAADRAAAVLRGTTEDELERMTAQAAAFGPTELSRAADVVNTALTEMTGATSPRLHLELMVARVLVPASDDTERGALARVERLERRVGVADASSPAPVAAVPAQTRTTSVEAPVPAARTAAVAEPVPAPRSAPVAEPVEAPASGAAPVPEPVEVATGSPTVPPGPARVGPLTLQQVRDAWPEILDRVEKTKRSSWMVVFASQARALNGDVLTVAFQSETDATRFKEQLQGAGESVSEHLRRAILDVLGMRVKFIARVESGGPVEDLAPPPEPDYEPGDPYDAGPVGMPPVEVPPGTVPEQERSAPAAPQPQAAPTQAAQTHPPRPAATKAEPPGQPQKSAPRTAEPARSQPSTGGWSVVQIPQSEPSGDDAAPAGRAAPLAGAPRQEAPPAPVPSPVVLAGSETDARPPVVSGAGSGPGTGSGPGPSANTASTPSAPPPPAPRQAPQRPAGERSPDDRRRYGESVVREILNASFIEEQKIAPPPPRPEF
jgi:DNA polymerase III subunit gamma/tau